MPASAFAAIVFAIIGFGFIYISNKQASKRKRLQLSGLQVDGLIIGLEKDKSSDSNLTYPVVKFTTLERRMIVVKYDLGTQPASYHLGEQVNVLYNPAEPAEFVLNPDSIAWEVYVFGVLGIASIVFSLYLEIKI